MAYYVLNLLLVAKLKIKSEQINSQPIDSDIDINIKLINAKHFFQMAQKKPQGVYLDLMYVEH